MQSVHACAVQTHFLFFVFCLKKGFPKCVNWVHVGVMFGEKCDMCVKNGVPETGSKKGDPPESNSHLFPCPEAPGAAPLRAHFSDKKQVFEQQVKLCSKFSLKK